MKTPRDLINFIPISQHFDDIFQQQNKESHSTQATTKRYVQETLEIFDNFKTMTLQAGFRKV